ncbi:ATP-binding cassette domain-containing protein, partial [Natrialbaceae archaeon GCM10025810]
MSNDNTLSQAGVQSDDTTSSATTDGTRNSTEDRALVDVSNTITADGDADARPEASTVLAARDLDVYYGDERALQGVDIEIPENRVTAVIGPSGCGKSTFLRCINRMNDLVDAARVEGEIRFNGKNVYDDDVDPVALRRRIGMVFQQPN